MNASARASATPNPGRRATKASVCAILASLLVGPATARAQAAKGSLTQSAGAAGCLSEGGSDGCTSVDLLRGPFAVALTGDGRHAYAALIDGRAVTALSRSKITGGLTPLAGPGACISQTGSGGLCATGRGLHAPLAIVVTPDGKHVYAASQQRDPVTLSAIALFARDPDSGLLTQLPGARGCVSEDPGAGDCTPGIALQSVRNLAVSRDGRHVYAASESDAVAVFARDAVTGDLRQLPEPRGCISQSGSGGRCTQGKALDGAEGIAISRDGRFVYVASETSRAVAVFARNRSTGALTQLPGTLGCIADNAMTEGCTDGVGLGSPTSIAIAPNGKSVYVASPWSDQLAVLARNPKTGALEHEHCLQEDGSVVCEPAVGLNQPGAVTTSPDGKHVYVASRDSDAVAAFASDRRTGTLHQLPMLAACISEDGSEGACSDGRALAGPRSVSVSRDGRHAYVATQGSHAIAVLQRRR